MSNMTNQAWLAAARRQIVLDTAFSTDCAVERAAANKDAARHIQQAALMAARAGRRDVAESLLAAWEQLDSRR
jgi:hypothetical protein